MANALSADDAVDVSGLDLALRRCSCRLGIHHLRLGDTPSV